MLKAASQDSLMAESQLVMLDEGDPYLPLAVQIVSGELVAAGWPAFRERYAQAHVMHAFRELLSHSSPSPAASPQTPNPAVWMSRVLCLIGERTGVSSGQHRAALSIPDHWKSPPPGFAQGVAASGWRPAVLVREWQAVAAGRVRSQEEHALFASLGFGPATVTLCRLISGEWQALETVRIVACAGQRLRERIVHQAAEQFIAETRRDPREDAAAYAELRSAVDHLVQQLTHHTSAVLSVAFRGHSLLRSYGGMDLALACEDFRLQLTAAVSRLLKERQLGTVEIHLWGELAALLPVGEWLAEFARDGQPGQHGLDAVAHGAARLCAVACESDLLTAAAILGSWPIPADRSPDAGHDPAPECAVLLSLPVAATRHGLPQIGRIRSLEQSPQLALEQPITRQLLIGRNPGAGCPLSSEAYPQVSFEHCVIVREGKEFFIKDLNSTNGTYVNSERVALQKLKHGDEIRLGEAGPQFRFELG